MQGDGQRWQVLCKQATTEEDPEKLMELIREISRDLEAKEDRLRSKGRDYFNSGSGRSKV